MPNFRWLRRNQGVILPVTAMMLVVAAVGRVLTQKKGEWVLLCPVISGESHTGWVQVKGFVAFKLTHVEDQGADKYLEGLWAGGVKLVQ